MDFSKFWAAFRFETPLSAFYLFLSSFFCLLVEVVGLLFFGHWCVHKRLSNFQVDSRGPRRVAATHRSVHVFTSGALSP